MAVYCSLKYVPISFPHKGLEDNFVTPLWDDEKEMKSCYYS